MTDQKQREMRRPRQAREIEQNQDDHRRSIAESQQLVDEAVEIHAAVTA